MLSNNPTDQLIAAIQTRLGLKELFYIIQDKVHDEFVFASENEANKFNNYLFKELSIGSHANPRIQKKVTVQNNQATVFTTHIQYETIKKAFQQDKSADINELPSKIDPLTTDNEALTKLKAYLDYIEKSIEFDAKTKEDAKKIVVCMMFIKINMDFLAYACTHKKDERIYTYLKKTDEHESDDKKEVVRDFGDTAIHIHYETQEKCRKELGLLVGQFEEAVENVTNNNNLINFTNKFIFDDKKGCIDARIGAAIEYAATISSTTNCQLTDIMMEALAETNYDDIEDSELAYKTIHQYFKDKKLLGTTCIRRKSITQPTTADPTKTQTVNIDEDALLTPHVIDNYLLDLGNKIHFKHTTADDIFNFLRKQQILVKGIDSIPGETKHWDFILERLADPANNRKPKPFDSTVDLAKIDRNEIYNPKTGNWEKRVASTVRGLPKDTPYIKATSTSLSPYDGAMDYFKDIGLIFDINKCKVKEKYIFEKNGGTDSRWWIKGIGSLFMKASPIEKLRENNKNARKTKTVPQRNEIYCSPQKDAVLGILMKKDDLVTGLNAINRKQHTMRVLGLETLPIVILDNSGYPKQFTLQQQIDAIIKGLENNLSEVEHIDLMGFFDDDLIKAMASTTLEKLVLLAMKKSKSNLVLNILKKRTDIHGTAFDWETGKNGLHYAIEHNHSAIAKELVKRQTREELEATDLDGKTPFMLAHELNRIEICEEILANSKMIPLDSDESFEEHLTSLCKFGLFDLAIAALNAKPDFKCNPSRAGKTALHYAIEANKLELVEILCQPGKASLMAEIYGRTPLLYAVFKKAYDVYPLLYNLTVDLHDGKQLERCLFYLIQDNKTDLIYIILMNKALPLEFNLCLCIPSNNNNSLHLLVMNNNTNLLRMLAPKFKLEITAKNRRGKDPLHFALDNNDMQSLQILLETCINRIPAQRLWEVVVELLTKNIELAAYIMTNEEIDIIETDPKIAAKNFITLMKASQYSLALLYLEKHPHIDVKYIDQDNQNYSLMHYVAESGDIPLFQKLLSLGAPLWQGDKNHNKAINIAAEKHPALCKEMIMTGTFCNISTVDAGYLCLALVQQKQAAYLLHLVIDRYPHIADALNITACKYNYQTTLHYIAESNDQTLIAKVSQLADHSKGNSKQNVPLEIAMYTNIQTAETMIEHANDSIKKIDCDIIGKIAYGLAERTCFTSLTTLLTKYGKIISLYKNQHGQTMLSHAVIPGNDTCVFSICRHIQPVINIAQSQIQIAIDQNLWEQAIHIYKAFHAAFPVESRIAYFDLLNQNTTLPYSMALFISGTTVEDQRTRAYQFLNNYIKNSKASEQIENLLVFLDDNFNKLEFLWKRIANLGLSLHFHSYKQLSTNKTQSVSNTWVILINEAKTKLVELANTEKPIITTATTAAQTKKQA